jgi:hypothetical protein
MLIHELYAMDEKGYDFFPPEKLGINRTKTDMPVEILLHDRLLHFLLPMLQ